jgi:D-glycero-alpha-D-manno-heptose-7-phosphate kinase
MIVATCPLRVSLFGGSSDNPKFISEYGFGQVISFTCNLKTYAMMTEDKMGFNRSGHKYIINYSRHEEVYKISDIENEVVRLVLDHFDLPPMTICLNSDVYSQGSGLASSSSYLISLIKAASIFTNTKMTDVEICKLAYELELKFNPHCGYQDPYGCGIGGFKHMRFYREGKINNEFLGIDLFRSYDAHLIFTGITRNSKTILEDVTKNIDRAQPLVKLVDDARVVLEDKNYEEFFNLFKLSWTEKKNTSRMILENPQLIEMDEVLLKNNTVMAHKLCGAGNGGFFLIFSEKNKLRIPYEAISINVSQNGVKGSII